MGRLLRRLIKWLKRVMFIRLLTLQTVRDIFLLIGPLQQFNLEKAVAVTRTPQAEPISLAETRRRGEFESYAGCFMKISLHPIGEGHPF